MLLIKNRKKTLRSIRESFNFFGYDTSSISDEQMGESIKEIGIQMRSFGITTSKAIENLKELKLKIYLKKEMN